MEDLSSLADGAMWTTDQSGGNMASGRPKAMSAPGSDPVTGLDVSRHAGDPKVTMSNSTPIQPGKASGRPQPVHQLPGGRPAWTRPRGGKE